MSMTEVTNLTQEYRNVLIAELKESSTNPRKTFDEGRLAELTESIRSKGVLSPLLVRRVNGHYEIVAGAQRLRAAQRAGLRQVPVRVTAFTDAEAQETQLIENLLRTDLHPFEEAQGFRALLDREGGKYSIETIAARTGKPAAFVAKRLTLLDLIKPAADAFTTGQIAIEHALLIGKLTPDVQEEALGRCFDGYYGANDKERSLVPTSRLAAWIEHNIYLSLKSVPFSKDDETLVPETGSCATCRKRTGFNTLLFAEVREDFCTDRLCFNRKLDAHIAQRVAKIPKLVQISDGHSATEQTPVLPRRQYVEVIARKNGKGKDALPEHKPCNHLTPAIHTDGMEKGRLVKVCANPECKIHFGDRQKEEQERRQRKAEKLAANWKEKQTLAFRHRILAEVLKHAKPPFGTNELRLVARFVLGALSHDLACRLAKRHGLEPATKGQDWELAQKAHALYKTVSGTALAALVVEAMLLGVAGQTFQQEDDPLLDAARHYDVDVKALRRETEKAEKEKALKLKPPKGERGSPSSRRK